MFSYRVVMIDEVDETTSEMNRTKVEHVCLEGGEG